MEEQQQLEQQQTAISETNLKQSQPTQRQTLEDKLRPRNQRKNKSNSEEGNLNNSKEDVVTTDLTTSAASVVSSPRHNNTSMQQQLPVTATTTGIQLPSSSQQQQHRKTSRKTLRIPWHKKIRNSPNNIRIYDLLRGILQHQRRRHILHLMEYSRRLHKECTVDNKILRKYLKDPRSYVGVDNLSYMIADTQHVATAKAE